MNPNPSWPLLSLRIGTAVPGPRGQLTAIDKHEVSRAQYLEENRFRKDQQGDTQHHGGPEKAVHHYATEHYQTWIEELSDLPVQNLQEGGFGENLCTMGLTEKDVAIGDIFELGDAVIQVSQPRQPCWKLNERFNVPDMAVRVQSSGRTGWYYRVLQTGWVQPDDLLRRTTRPQPNWTVARVLRALYDERLEGDELAALAELAELSPRLRDLAAKRLSSMTVEDWTRRLHGP